MEFDKIWRGQKVVFMNYLENDDYRKIGPEITEFKLQDNLPYRFNNIWKGYKLVFDYVLDKGLDEVDILKEQADLVSEESLHVTVKEPEPELELIPQHLSTQHLSTQHLAAQPAPQPAAQSQPGKSVHTDSNGKIDGLIVNNCQIIFANEGKGVTEYGKGKQLGQYVIVNAANEEGLGGGGIDGIITQLGGKDLADARKALPIIIPCPNTVHNIGIPNDCNICKRIQTGNAVITGPNRPNGHPIQYGRLHVNYVIHAVGPNYHLTDATSGDILLRKAYTKSLTLATENDIPNIGFCILSGSIFRHNRPLEEIINIAFNAVTTYCRDTPNHMLQEIKLYGYLPIEQIEFEKIKTKISTGQIGGSKDESAKPEEYTFF